MDAFDLFILSLKTIFIILYAPVLIAIFVFVILMFISQFMDFPWRNK